MCNRPMDEAIVHVHVCTIHIHMYAHAWIQKIAYTCTCRLGIQLVYVLYMGW